ncbi:SH3 domain-containing protein 21 isoform X3 [Polyodon spathula]|uniref:SH3 domain-containing protein 21 isoform X3 n=1 Tax=Polyodon spathula TaxID=7913 RepID=UPI001B7DAB71|nr:SH3 domain-containing protein 21 isoform X3 [Polyodon spathula]
MVYYVYRMFCCCWERDESLIEDGGKTLKEKQTLCEVTFAYSPLDKDELELKEGEIIEFIKEIEDGWWLGNKNGKIGAFPSNFVKTITETTDGPNSSAVKQRPKLSEALFNKELEKLPKLQHTSGAGQRLDINQDNERCKVMFDYTATAEDELDLKKGDIVVIINKDTDDEGWWEGELNGKRGFFPDNFVMVLPTACLMLENTDRPLRMLDKSSGKTWTHCRISVSSFKCCIVIHVTKPQCSCKHWKKIRKRSKQYVYSWKGSKQYIWNLERFSLRQT